MPGIRLSIGCEKFSAKRVKNPHFSSFRSASETHLLATNTFTLFGFFSVFCLSFLAISLFSPPLFLSGVCPPVKMSTEAAAPQMSGLQLYSRFAFAGAVCCSVTHGALTPVDV